MQSFTGVRVCPSLAVVATDLLTSGSPLEITESSLERTGGHCRLKSRREKSDQSSWRERTVRSAPLKEASRSTREQDSRRLDWMNQLSTLQTTRECPRRLLGLGGCRQGKKQPTEKNLMG
jgi:hypothetical protein